MLFAADVFCRKTVNFAGDVLEFTPIIKRTVHYLVLFETVRFTTQSGGVLLSGFTSQAPAVWQPRGSNLRN